MADILPIAHHLISCSCAVCEKLAQLPCGFSNQLWNAIITDEKQKSIVFLMLCPSAGEWVCKFIFRHCGDNFRISFFPSLK
jgi:hypothetical protein